MNDPGVVVAPRNGNRGPDGDGMKESGGKLLRHADAAVRGGCAGTGNVARMQSNSGSGQAHPVGHGCGDIFAPGGDGVFRVRDAVDFFSHRILDPPVAVGSLVGDLLLHAVTPRRSVVTFSARSNVGGGDTPAMAGDMEALFAQVDVNPDGPLPVIL